MSEHKNTIQFKEENPDIEKYMEDNLDSFQPVSIVGFVSVILDPQYGLYWAMYLTPENHQNFNGPWQDTESAEKQAYEMYKKYLPSVLRLDTLIPPMKWLEIAGAYMQENPDLDIDITGYKEEFPRHVLKKVVSELK